MSQLKGVAVGAGYFSQFHLEAWSRMEGVTIAAICDQDAGAAKRAAGRFGIGKQYIDFAEMLDAEKTGFRGHHHSS